MSRTHLLALVLIGLLVIGGVLAFSLFSPALSAAAGCRRAMQQTEGYGPWQTQATRLVDQADQSEVVSAYFDGYNTAECVAKQYGPIWIVRGVGQTLVACSRGLTDNGSQGCPRGRYGVTP